MTLTTHTQHLLSRLQELIVVNDDEIVQRGITQAAMERIIALRRRAAQFANQYISPEKLEAKIKRQGLSPDDHTPYTDLLEWRAVRHELEQLTLFLEAA